MNQSHRSQQISVPNPSQLLQDNITKAKNLMISLNLSLRNLFEAARCDINNDKKENFEKAFEDFCSIMDQIELNLITALNCFKQGECSRKYLPLPVNVNPQPNSWTYSQYFNMTKAHIKHIEDIRNIFSFKEQL